MGIQWTSAIIVLPIFLYCYCDPGDISKEKCKEYAKAVYTEEDSPVLLPGAEKNKVSVCGIVEVPLIIGGVKAGGKEFPHMAVIGFGSEGSISWMCGGALVSEQYVLTAAHCMDSGEKGLAKWVRLGDLNLEEEDDDAKPQQFAIVERIPHPEYKPPSRYNDIALVKLDSEASFDAYVRPACVNVEFNFPGTKGIATGFGRLQYGSAGGSKDLMKVQLSFIPSDKCNQSFITDIGKRQMRSGVIDSTLCAGEYAGGKDTCQGDSGGPLQIVLEEPYCMYSIVGVTSFGRFCGFANSPAIYSRVSHFIPWIEKVVWKS